MTPPAKYEPRVQSERKKGKSVQEGVDGAYRGNTLVLKLHETEANCTFGVINNNSVEKGQDNGSQYQKTSIASSQENISAAAIKIAQKKFKINKKQS